MDLVDLWLLIDPGLQPRAVNEVAKLVLSTIYWLVVATILMALVAWIG